MSKIDAMTDDQIEAAFAMKGSAHSADAQKFLDGLSIEETSAFLRRVAAISERKPTAGQRFKHVLGDLLHGDVADACGDGSTEN